MAEIKLLKLRKIEWANIMKNRIGKALAWALIISAALVLFISDITKKFFRNYFPSTFFQNLYWFLKCLAAVIASIAVLIFLITVNAQSRKESQSAKQAVYNNMIEQIESANSEPVIVLGGKYRATRCEKPYEHCVNICKLMDVKKGEGK